MSRTGKWAVGALALIPLGLGIPLIAQSAGKPDDRNRAKTMAELIKAGQLNLADATDLAEQHTRGTALQATCDIVRGDDKSRTRNQPGQGGGPQDRTMQDDQRDRDRQPAGGERIEYTVCCFADGKIQSVRIDGQSKTILDVKEKQSLKDDTHSDQR